jgi:leucyl aminopeptidase
MIKTKLTYGEPAADIRGASAGAAGAGVHILFVTEEEAGGTTPLVQEHIDAELRRAVSRGLFKGKPEQAFSAPTLGLFKMPYVLFVGYKPGEGREGLRLAAAAAAKELKALAAETASIDLRASILQEEVKALGAAAVSQALTEGLLLSLHDRLPLKREPAVRYQPLQVGLVPDAGLQQLAPQEEWEQGIASGLVIVEAVAFARDLTNLPGNDLTPERLAFFAEELAHEYELDVEIIDEWTAAEQGMGGLLGVGQGSVNPPRMIVLHYKGDPDSDDVWGWIGKGITFDTGGISLKRAPGMEEMISDMGGAAAVLGALRAVAELKAKANIVAVIPAAENMPSDRALKPGDVLTTMSGYTIEVVNTDAEGRIVLADGLTTAIRRGATRLVDVATLTGAVMHTLGYEATGAVTNNPGLLKEIMAAADRAGERVWELPVYPEFRKPLSSVAADLRNGAGRYGAATTGGLFIGHFAEGLPWVHLDIGGSSWLEDDKALEPKGATGTITRTLVELVCQK